MNPFDIYKMANMLLLCTLLYFFQMENLKSTQNFLRPRSILKRHKLNIKLKMDTKSPDMEVCCFLFIRLISFIVANVNVTDIQSCFKSLSQCTHRRIFDLLKKNRCSRRMLYVCTKHKNLYNTFALQWLMKTAFVHMRHSIATDYFAIKMRQHQKVCKVMHEFKWPKN